jgi:hypothetical protein
MTEFLASDTYIEIKDIHRDQGHNSHLPNIELVNMKRNVCPRMIQNMLMTRIPLMDVITFGGTFVLKIFVVFRTSEKQQRRSKINPLKKEMNKLK